METPVHPTDLSHEARCSTKIMTHETTPKTTIKTYRIGRLGKAIGVCLIFATLLGGALAQTETRPDTPEAMRAQLEQMRQQIEALQQQVARLEEQLARAEAVDDVNDADEADNDMSPAEQVRRDMAGDDLEGKDGPLAKVGADLALLYRQYQRHEQQNPQTPFRAHDPMMPVEDGYVLIDAVAGGSASALRAELERYGLREASSFGRVVSGLLPIMAIDDIARLDNLRSARAALAN